MLTSIIFCLLLPVLSYSFEPLKARIHVDPIIAGSTPPFENFDPLNLDSSDRLTYYREAELKHCRVAMVSAVSIPIVEQITNKPGIFAFSDLDTNIQLGIVGVMFISEFASMIKGWENPLYKKFTIKSDYQPGDLGFKFAKDIDLDMYNKELNNGRLAMIASLGMIVQELATGKCLF